MNKLLKKKKGGKKKSKAKTKKETKKTTTLFADAKDNENKEVNDAWGEEEEGFVIEYKVKEKTVDLSEKPAAVNLDNEWKDEEFIPKKIEPAKEDPNKKKKIAWGDGIKKSAKTEKIISEEAFPELGEQPIIPKKKKKQMQAAAAEPKPQEDGVRRFFNSKGTVNENLKKLMTKTQPLLSEQMAAETENQKTDKFEEGQVEIKGKVAFKYEKSEAEIRREKMLQEIAEKEKAAKEAKAAPQKPSGPRQFFSSKRNFDRPQTRTFTSNRDQGRPNKTSAVLSRRVEAAPAPAPALAPAKLAPMKLAPTRLGPANLKGKKLITEDAAPTRAGFSRGFGEERSNGFGGNGGRPADFGRGFRNDRGSGGFGNSGRTQPSNGKTFGRGLIA